MAAFLHLGHGTHTQGGACLQHKRHEEASPRARDDVSLTTQVSNNRIFYILEVQHHMV
jgi:hypothetical protein